MSDTSVINPFQTHQVRNQSQPFGAVNLFAVDIVLQAALQRESGADAAGQAQQAVQCHVLGQSIADAAAQDWPRLANVYSPRLQSYNTRGQRNAIVVQRLKDKLGNRANASSEVAFQGAQAWMLGPPGKGPLPALWKWAVAANFGCLPDGVDAAAILRRALPD